MAASKWLKDHGKVLFGSMIGLVLIGLILFGLYKWNPLSWGEKAETPTPAKIEQPVLPPPPPPSQMSERERREQEQAAKVDAKRDY